VDSQSWDELEAYLRIHGQRHIATDTEALRRHLDACVRPKVARENMSVVT